ncbi:MAG: hypothetical protein K0R14_1905 [Burkholderiales bacterium]|jgi:hypothetical protein|nr:hypothetical protein [Burkholderiales bacterium]
MFIPFKKATLLIPSSPNNLKDTKHLFIILTDPAQTRQSEVLLVNVSTIRNGIIFDEACIIEPGEHPFIKNRSFIFYRHARLEESKNLIRKVKSGEFIAHEAISDILYNKIAAGLLKSKFLASKFKYFYQEHCKNV